MVGVTTLYLRDVPEALYSASCAAGHVATAAR